MRRNAFRTSTQARQLLQEPHMTSYRSGPTTAPVRRFGGQFAETPMPLINQLAAEYGKAKSDPAFSRSWPISSVTTSAAPARCTSPSA